MGTWKSQAPAMRNSTVKGSFPYRPSLHFTAINKSSTGKASEIID